MKQSRSLIRFGVVVALLVATALAIAEHRNRPAVAPRAEKLANLPMTLGEWAGKDIPLDAEVVKMLGADGDYLSRIYSTDGAKPWVSLYIAYFARSYSGEGIHSPKNCLPGSGWSFLESSYITMHVPGRPNWQAGRYIIANGPARQLVLYWYHAGSRKYASEYAGKVYSITDAIRTHRTDAALVRIITPISSAESAQVAEARAIQFSRQLVSTLPRFIPD